MKKTNGKAHVSKETFDEFLASQGMLAACEDHAIKEIIAGQLADAMKAEGIGKTEMAIRMQTSRRQFDRLFDPAIPSVMKCTLHVRHGRKSDRGLGFHDGSGDVG